MFGKDKHYSLKPCLVNQFCFWLRVHSSVSWADRLEVKNGDGPCFVFLLVCGIGMILCVSLGELYTSHTVGASQLKRKKMGGKHETSVQTDLHLSSFLTCGLLWPLVSGGVW